MQVLDKFEDLPREFLLYPEDYTLRERRAVLNWLEEHDFRGGNTGRRITTHQIYHAFLSPSSAARGRIKIEPKHSIGGNAFFTGSFGRAKPFKLSIGKTLTNKQVFEMFLKKHRAYSAYMRNINNTYISHRCPSVDEMMHCHVVREAIVDAFDWAASDQGHSFWSHLNRKWKQLADDLKLKENKK